MAFVKFYRGKKASYDSTTYADCLYFTTDTNELLLNGESIGANRLFSSDASLLFDEQGDGNVDASVNLDDETITQNDDGQLYVVNALSDSEKTWIEEQLFDELFTISISSSSDNSNGHWFEGESYTVTFTLTCKYDGTLVDLTSTPSGWTYVSTGTYTITKTVSSTTGTSVSSGTVTCYYSIGSKSTSASWANYKHSYIYLSTDSEFDTDLTIDEIEADENTITMNSSNNTISGDYTIDITESGQYVYFVIANTSTLNSVTQLGLNYIQDGYTSFTDDSYGTYKIYRSSNSMSVGSQDITVS